ncbi:fibronectin type III-like domain-contianing protein [Actinomadura verrucosospora]
MRAARVAFPLPARALSYWNQATASWKQAPGCTKVTMVGASFPRHP